MQLSFLGAAREVTGSCFLVETADTRFLVDCGMVQGGREASVRNRNPFAFDPESIDFVLLTERLRAEHGWDATVPESGQRVQWAGRQAGADRHDQV